MSTSIRRTWLGAKAKLLLIPLAVALALGVALGARGESKLDALASADAPARRSPALPEVPSLAGVWMLLVALGVGGLAVVFVAKRKGLARAGTGQLTVVDSLVLGPKRLVHLVRCGDRRFLLANSEAGITCLATLPQEFDDADVDRLANDPGAAGEFRRMLEPAGMSA